MSESGVVVVGAGPRGSSIVERLAANFAAGAGKLTVHLVDPAPAGGGRIWRADQPAHLLMNTLCADATHFVDDTVDCAGPLVTGPTLYEWAQQVKSGDLASDDPDIAVECEGIEPHGHPSRKLLGAYLRWCHLRDLERLPAGVTVVSHQALAVAAEPVAEGWEVTLSHGPTLHAQAVVLCNGHVDLVPVGAEAVRVDHARAVGAWYGPPANPTDVDLEVLAPGEPVIVRGLGMNFFDYMSLVTIGRGGRFESTSGARVRYLPSGEEPILYVGSRRGIPYRAKGMFGRMTPKFPARYLTAEVINQLCTTPGVDFRRQMWPLIAKDAAWVYYDVLQRVEPEKFGVDPRKVFAALDSYQWDSVELNEVIQSATEQPLDFGSWDRPLDNASFGSVEEFGDWWMADLDHDLSEAEKGMDSAEKCAGVAMGQGRAPLRRMVTGGGLRGHSYDRDVDRWFRGFAGSLASGPPARRIAELMALTEAGLVQPLGPALQITDTDTGFEAVSPAVQGSTVSARALLEAHLPPNRLQHTADPLLAQLRERGLARPYLMPDPSTGRPFETGAVDVAASPYEVIDQHGSPQRGLYAFGVPVEHLHYGTQLGPLARTNSQFLRDSDAVARAVIGLVAGEHALVAARTAEQRRGQES